MRSRVGEYEVLQHFFHPRCNSYDSFITKSKVNGRQYLLTKYNLAMLNCPKDLLISRILFLMNNYKLFRCESVFFQTSLASRNQITPENIGTKLTYFYVVEPLPMVTLADYFASENNDSDFLKKQIPNVLNTLSALHSSKFPYLCLSPFTIIIDGKLWLRPPPICPYSSPKSLLPPPPHIKGDEGRKVDEMRFYRAPEWKMYPPVVQSDTWSLGTILAEYVVLGHPLFESSTDTEQQELTQKLLGEAPAEFKWPLVHDYDLIELPPVIMKLLDYDFHFRPALCVSISLQIMTLFDVEGGDTENNPYEYEYEYEYEESCDEDAKSRPICIILPGETIKASPEREKKKIAVKYQKTSSSSNDSASIKDLAEPYTPPHTVKEKYSPISNSSSVPIQRKISPDRNEKKFAISSDDEQEQSPPDNKSQSSSNRSLNRQRPTPIKLENSALDSPEEIPPQKEQNKTSPHDKDFYLKQLQEIQISDQLNIKISPIDRSNNEEKKSPRSPTEKSPKFGQDSFSPKSSSQIKESSPKSDSSKSSLSKNLSPRRRMNKPSKDKTSSSEKSSSKSSGRVKSMKIPAKSSKTPIFVDQSDTPMRPLVPMRRTTVSDNSGHYSVVKHPIFSEDDSIRSLPIQRKSLPMDYKYYPKFTDSPRHDLLVSTPEGRNHVEGVFYDSGVPSKAKVSFNRYYKFHSESSDYDDYEEEFEETEKSLWEIKQNMGKMKRKLDNLDNEIFNSCNSARTERSIKKSNTLFENSFSPRSPH
ncbi:hypothetical protein TVAG_369000 [Trichomonas vaginalis G3]|uniref:non-specific serine/threonine protein kinase n=1 Tax=Trichomonas vaginalis (strain ATCC PRA-98 / G3) TaxID=412133 RepID=A2EV05_TRIV3|nr:casein kinase II subunit alpha family [Trichomonas vaginalis G3]EAY03528.1 hypothetical protein TVAG_369000 [Trichomonas vaginalis G3]KAI5537501.1 casein kinase II subunit alpha family [Trichomonas vaginalis G3]|eukprot:XP_001315751.1 hypothetical protein [Trichomonas vaginalis G3]